MGAAHGNAEMDQFTFSCYRDYKPKDEDAREKTEPKPFRNILKSVWIRMPRHWPHGQRCARRGRSASIIVIMSRPA